MPLAAYPASQAPGWRIGAKLYLGFAVGALCLYFGIWFGLRWEEGRGGEKRVGSEGEEREVVRTRKSGEVVGEKI